MPDVVTTVAADATDMNATVDRVLCRSIAEWYDIAASDGSASVCRSYDELARQTRCQFDAMIGQGISVHPWKHDSQPYADSAHMRSEVARTGELHVYLTCYGHGAGRGDRTTSPHPMCADSDVVIDGHLFSWNDLFRAVHDYFGHYVPGQNFSLRGELAAAYRHSLMYTRDVHPVLLSETVGQICWFYYGPHLRRASGELPARGDADYVPLERRPFSEQKYVALPECYIDRFFAQF